MILCDPHRFDAASSAELGVNVLEMELHAVMTQTQVTCDLLVGSPGAVDAESALRIGLINHVAPAGQCLTLALDLARRIAVQPPHAVSLIKRLVHDGATTSLRAHLDTVSSHMAVVEDSPEFKKRVHAFKTRKR